MSSRAGTYPETKATPATGAVRVHSAIMTTTITAAAAIPPGMPNANAKSTPGDVMTAMRLLPVLLLLLPLLLPTSEVTVTEPVDGEGAADDDESDTEGPPEDEILVDWLDRPEDERDDTVEEDVDEHAKAPDDPDETPVDVTPVPVLLEDGDPEDDEDTEDLAVDVVAVPDEEGSADEDEEDTGGNSEQLLPNVPLGHEHPLSNVLTTPPV